MGIIPNKQNREGVALILVVGMLALLMVMGVAFAVFMRTERIAAGNFRNDVQARQLLHVALERVIEQIDATTTNIYPQWDLLQSTNLFVSGDASVITSGSAMAWVPLGAFPAGTVLAPKWVGVGVAGCTGRVAYLVFNASGLIDANYAGGAKRLGGTNCAEIQVMSLPEIAGSASVGSLTNNRPYETEQELAALGTNILFARAQPEVLVDYSAFPTGAEVNIRGDYNYLVNHQQEITPAFTNCGFDMLQAGILFTNLCDYVDGDNVPGNCGSGPGNPSGPYVEPVWMMNEIGVSQTLDVISNAPSSYQVTGTVTIAWEAIFPFKQAVRTGFKTEINASFSNTVSSVYSPPSYVSGGRSMRGVGSETLYYTNNSGALSLVGGIVNAPPPASIPMQADIVAVVKNSDGVIVDVVSNKLAWTVSISGGGGMWHGSGAVDKECDDPRLNYDSARWSVAASPSLGAENASATALFSPRGKDGDMAMFVRNDQIGSVGELGYLFFWCAR